MNIVFVDDSKIVLETLKSITEEISEELVNVDINSYFFNDPVEFLQLAKSEKVEFELAFFDINMPKLSGFDLTTEIKSLQQFRFTPIVAITTEVSKSAKIEGKRVGMSGWLVKSTAQNLIKDSLGKIIKRVSNR
jgi:two-component system chemotaxis response regulator CheY